MTDSELMLIKPAFLAPAYPIELVDVTHAYFAGSASQVDPRGLREAVGIL